jgi:hypothetical protein
MVGNRVDSFATLDVGWHVEKVWACGAGAGAGAEEDAGGIGGVQNGTGSGGGASASVAGQVYAASVSSAAVSVFAADGLGA